MWQTYIKLETILTVPPSSRLSRFVYHIMRHLAAYLLLQIGGNANPTAEDIKRVLASVDIEADEGRLRQLLVGVKGRTVDELIKEGSAMLASVPSGKPDSAAVIENTNATTVEEDEGGIVEEEIVFGGSDDGEDFLGLFG
ncbi:hypothetical protein BU17DRAFT_66154 [Hysterangium stoloniferum]|nr:hypothetical protein BU17DRAFT_66154 [Hysterangium stoloniferum]